MNMLEKITKLFGNDMSLLVVKKGTWHSYYKCIKCEHQLSFDQMIDSGGTCPYCGNYDAGTVVDAAKLSRRYLYTVFYPWYLFFLKFKNKGFWEYKNALGKYSYDQHLKYQEKINIQNAIDEKNNFPGCYNQNPIKEA
jgi:hypothetical protein